VDLNKGVHRSIWSTKKLLVTALVLALYDPSVPMKMPGDTSAYALGQWFPLMGANGWVNHARECIWILQVRSWGECTSPSKWLQCNSVFWLNWCKWCKNVTWITCVLEVTSQWVEKTLDHRNQSGILQKVQNNFLPLRWIEAQMHPLPCPLYDLQTIIILSIKLWTDTCELCIL